MNEELRMKNEGGEGAEVGGPRSEIRGREEGEREQPGQLESRELRISRKDRIWREGGAIRNEKL